MSTLIILKKEATPNHPPPSVPLIYDTYLDLSKARSSSSAVDTVSAWSGTIPAGILDWQINALNHLCGRLKASVIGKIVQSQYSAIGSQNTAKYKIMFCLLE